MVNELMNERLFEEPKKCTRATFKSKYYNKNCVYSKTLYNSTVIPDLNFYEKEFNPEGFKA